MTNSPELREEDIRLLIEATRGSSSTTTAAATPTAQAQPTEEENVAVTSKATDTTAAAATTEVATVVEDVVLEEPASITQEKINDAPRIEKRSLEEDEENEQPQEKRRRSSVIDGPVGGDVEMVDAPPTQTESPPNPPTVLPEPQPQQIQDVQQDPQSQNEQQETLPTPPSNIQSVPTPIAQPQATNSPPPNAPSSPQAPADVAPEPSGQPPGAIEPDAMPERREGMMLWIAKQVKALGDQHNVSVESAPQDGETPERILEREKVREENRERKKRWREINQARNKDNDLRCRVTKRANKLFGHETSDKKTEWIQVEFNKRRAKREAKERAKRYDQNGNTIFSLNDNNTFSDSPAGKIIFDALSNAEGIPDAVKDQLQGISSLDQDSLAEVLTVLSTDENAMKALADYLIENGSDALAGFVGEVDLLAPQAGAVAMDAQDAFGGPAVTIEQLQEAVVQAEEVLPAPIVEEQRAPEAPVAEEVEQVVHMEVDPNEMEFEPTDMDGDPDINLLDLDLSPEMIAALQAATAVITEKGLDINDYATLQANLPESFTNIALNFASEELEHEPDVEMLEEGIANDVEGVAEEVKMEAQELAPAEVSEQRQPAVDPQVDEMAQAGEAEQFPQMEEMEQADQEAQAGDEEFIGEMPQISIEDLAGMDLSTLDEDQIAALYAMVGQAIGDGEEEGEVEEEAMAEEQPIPEAEVVEEAPLVPELPAEIEQHAEAQVAEDLTVDEILNSTAGGETNEDQTTDLASQLVQALVQQIITTSQQKEQRPRSTCTTSVFPADPQRPMKQRGRPPLPHRAAIRAKQQAAKLAAQQAAQQAAMKPEEPVPVPLPPQPQQPQQAPPPPPSPTPPPPPPPPPAPPVLQTPQPVPQPVAAPQPVPQQAPKQLSQPQQHVVQQHVVQRPSPPQLPHPPMPPSAYMLRPQLSMKPIKIIQQTPRSALNDDQTIPPEVAKLLKRPAFFPKPPPLKPVGAAPVQKKDYIMDPRVRAMGFPPLLSTLKPPPVEGSS